MTKLKERFVRVTINDETYFREIGLDNVLGERMQKMNSII